MWNRLKVICRTVGYVKLVHSIFANFLQKKHKKTLILIWIKTELEYLWGSITLSFFFVGLFYVFLFKVRRHQNIINGRVRCAW